MTKTKHKILSVFLSVCMIISCMVGFTVTASADPIPTSGDFGNTLHWELSDNTLTISGTGAMPDYNYDEPYTTWKQSLYNDIKSVVISNGVTSIGKESLANLGITSVTIPSSVTTIGDNAFFYCIDLTSITLPDSITSIGEGAFNSCNKLSTVNIPANVTAINSMTFSGCALTSITIPAGVTSLGNSAFWCCSALTTVTFVRPSVTRGLSVESGAFDNCTATIAFSGSGTSTLYDGSAEITEGTALNTLDGDSYPDDPTTKKLTWKAPHDHSFTYSANGATITATCSVAECPLNDSKTTLTLVKPTLTTYGETGKSAAATLTGLDAFNSATLKTIATTGIKYIGRDGTTYTESTTAPSNAGKYTASITVEEQTASVKYEIAKADPTAPTGLTATYGQTLANVALPTGWTWADSTQSVGNVVSTAATFKANFAGNDNYNSASNVEVAVTVSKAANSATVTGTATVAKGGTVDLSGNVTLNDATGNVTYEISGDANGCTLNGSVLTAGNNAGSVTVNVTVAADDNHNELTATPIKVTILDHTHTMTHYSASSGNCQTRGHIEYWYCSGCGKYFVSAQ